MYVKRAIILTGVVSDFENVRQNINWSTIQLPHHFGTNSFLSPPPPSHFFFAHPRLEFKTFLAPSSPANVFKHLDFQHIVCTVSMYNLVPECLLLVRN